MKTRWLGLAALLAAAGSIIAYKEIARSPMAHAAPPVAKHAKSSVVLFADLGEAEASCGCGQIIRLVRAAASRGVATREVAEGSDRDLAARYKVTVTPTVLVLDESGAVAARYEGESNQTIEGLRAHLDKLGGGPK